MPVQTLSLGELVMSFPDRCCGRSLPTDGWEPEPVLTPIQEWTWPVAGEGDPINAPLTPGYVAWNVIGYASGPGSTSVFMPSAPYAHLDTSAMFSGRWVATPHTVYRIQMDVKSAGHPKFEVRFYDAGHAAISTQTMAAPQPSWPYFNINEPIKHYSGDFTSPPGTASMELMTSIGGAYADNFYIWAVG